MIIRSAVALGCMLSLAACGGGEDGTSISVKTGDGNAASANVDGSTGTLAVDLPGFKGQLSLPKFKLDADNIDLNGVKLFPGSTIRDLNIAANREGTGPKGDDAVSIAFDSPAAASEVRQWFEGKLTAAGYALKGDGQGLVGTTEEGAPFRLVLTPGTDDRSTGTITIGG